MLVSFVSIRFPDNKFIRNSIEWAFFGGHLVISTDLISRYISIDRGEKYEIAKKMFRLEKLPTNANDLQLNAVVNWLTTKIAYFYAHALAQSEVLNS